MPSHFQRLTLGLCVCSLLASCTHNPINGEKAFKNFNQCMAANSVGSVLGGILIGAAATSLSGKKNVGIAAGVAAATGGIWLSWQRCAAVYQTVENTEIKAQTSDKKVAINKLTIDKLEVEAGRPGENLKRTLRYTLNSAEGNTQDIQVKETTVIQVPRVANQPDNSLAFVDLNGKPITVGGKVLRPGQKNIPADELNYDDYSLATDVTIRPGTRKSDGLLPTDSHFPSDRPYRLKMIISGLNMQAEKSQIFSFRSK